MNRTLTACALAAVLAATAGCGPFKSHKQADPAGGVITSMAYTQSMDTGRSCTHTPAQAECAARWTIAYRDHAGTPHLAAVTKTVYDRCLPKFPGGHYPACAEGNHR